MAWCKTAVTPARALAMESLYKYSNGQALVLQIHELIFEGL